MEMMNVAKARSKKPSRFGLVIFDEQPTLVSSIVDARSRDNFIRSLDRIESSKSKTYLGRALDFSRLKQFL